MATTQWADNQPFATGTRLWGGGTEGLLYTVTVADAVTTSDTFQAAVGRFGYLGGRAIGVLKRRAGRFFEARR